MSGISKIGIPTNIGIGSRLGSTYWKPRYYVSPEGDDSKDGLSPLNAWRTIAKVNSMTFVSGDKIGFKKDGIWRETLTIGESGEEGNVIEFGAYGSGSLLPIISGADVINGFTAGTGTYGDELAPTEYGYHDGAPNWSYLTEEVGPIGGRSNVGKRLSDGISYMAGFSAIALTNVPHIITFDIYVPSTNTKTNGVRLREGQTTWTYFHDVTPTPNTWVTVSVQWTPKTLNNTIYLYLAKDGNDADVAIEDVVYFDNISIRIDAQPVTNVWNAALTTQPNIVIINGTRGAYKTSEALCTNYGDWFWTGDVLSVNYASDPSGLVEAGKRNQCVSGTADYISFEYIKFTGNQTFAIYCGGSDYNIRHCTFKQIGGRGQNGIGILIGGSNYTILYNTIIDIQNQGISSNGGAHTNIVIDYNDIRDCWNLLPYGNGSSGVGISANGLSNSFIRHNYVEGCNKNITITESSDTLVFKNISVNAVINCIDHNSGVSGHPTLVYNNTVIHNPNVPGSGHGIDTQVNGNHVRFKNNLIYVTFTTINVNVQGFCIADSAYLGIDTDYNLTYKIPASTAGLYKIDANLLNTLADWKTALAATSFSGKGVHDLSADPLFVNFATGDYRLQAGSPAIGAGVDVGLGETNPNIGAL